MSKAAMSSQIQPQSLSSCQAVPLSDSSHSSSHTRHRATLKSGSDLWAQKIKKQCTRNSEAWYASHKITHKKIDQISQNLSSDDHHRQSPSPKAASAPTRPGSMRSVPERESS